jgi:hypothetical protein
VIWLLSLVGVVLLALGALGLHLLGQMRWLIRETGRDRYFGRTLAERRKLKAEVGRRSRTVVPILRMLKKVHAPGMPVTVYHGVTVPGPNCPRRTMEQAARYEPTSTDIFVATQMKCGTTWMQQVVYETLCRGTGDLSDDGHRHMYALSPWIESNASVSMQDAPRVGPRGERIIKTHLPVSLCPYSEAARYVYVTRNPVACFASCVDFVRMLAGPMAPPLMELVDWYCSDDMWWRSWPEHVEGWWSWAQTRPNVLFVHYEDMLADLGAIVDQVALLLDTSNSMDGLIDQARSELWKVVNEFALAHRAGRPAGLEVALYE